MYVYFVRNFTRWEIHFSLEHVILCETLWDYPHMHIIYEFIWIHELGFIWIWFWPSRRCTSRNSFGFVLVVKKGWLMCPGNNLVKELIHGIIPNLIEWCPHHVLHVEFLDLLLGVAEILSGFPTRLAFWQAFNQIKYSRSSLQCCFLTTKSTKMHSNSRL